MSFLRTILILGRVSNLPTVWSNCLAGWWLGGDHHSDRLPFVLIGATFLYIAGMFLNDAFDVNFDRQYRKERPIPAGAISLKSVWLLGLAWLFFGVIILLWLGELPGAVGWALVFCIVLYDAIHKRIELSPVLMGLCRFFLYLIAASAGERGLTAASIWCGLALAAYVVGLSYLARRECAGGPLKFWSVFFLAVPVLVAIFKNPNGYSEGRFLLCAVLLLWTMRCLRHTLWSVERNIGLTVSGLLAGIVFVDWLAAANGPRELSFVFIALFLAARLFQRFIPAT